MRETVSESSLLKMVVVVACIVSSLFALLGVVLVYLGATGFSEISLFGQNISSASVGVTSIFIAAIVVIMLINRVLSSHDRSIPISHPAAADVAETAPSQQLLAQIAFVSDMVSTKYAPDLLMQLNHFQAEYPASEALHKVQECVSRIIEKLTNDVSSSKKEVDQKAQSGASEEEVNAMRSMQYGAHLVLNSLSDIFNQIAGGLNAGRTPEMILADVRHELTNLGKSKFPKPGATG